MAMPLLLASEPGGGAAEAGAGALAFAATCEGDAAGAAALSLALGPAGIAILTMRTLERTKFSGSLLMSRSALQLIHRGKLGL